MNPHELFKKSPVFFCVELLNINNSQFDKKTKQIRPWTSPCFAAADLKMWPDILGTIHSEPIFS